MATFRLLTALEPRLASLLAECQAEEAEAQGDPHYCANLVWHQKYKSRLCRLVGWGRRDVPELGTSLAYDVAYDVCYEALPGCRACGCLRVEYSADGVPRLV